MSDRFRIFAASNGRNARGWCRRCNYFEWADSDTRPDPAQIEQARQLRVEMAQQEERRLRAKIEQLRKDAYWQGYHDGMRERHRELWRQQGIADTLQDWFRLGYTEHRTFYNGGTAFDSAAMTIPHFDTGWEATNIQYRIMQPPVGVGKYRYTAGLPAPLFITEPDEPIKNSTVLVEGAKKAIVTWAHIGGTYKVVAVPSKMPGQRLIDKLKECDPLYIMLDPDAYSDGNSAKRIGRMVGDRVRYVRLPAKPDDMLTIYQMSAATMKQYIAQATKEC